MEGDKLAGVRGGCGETACCSCSREVVLGQDSFLLRRDAADWNSSQAAQATDVRHGLFLLDGASS